MFQRPIKAELNDPLLNPYCRARFIIKDLYFELLIFDKSLKIICVDNCEFKFTIPYCIKNERQYEKSFYCKEFKNVLYFKDIFKLITKELEKSAQISIRQFVKEQKNLIRFTFDSNVNLKKLVNLINDLVCFNERKINYKKLIKFQRSNEEITSPSDFFFTNLYLHDSIELYKFKDNFTDIELNKVKAFGFVSRLLKLYFPEYKILETKQYYFKQHKIKIKRSVIIILSSLIILVIFLITVLCLYLYFKKKFKF